MSDNPIDRFQTTASFLERWTSVIKRTPLSSATSEARAVECDLCGWKGRRIKARSAPCPNCGNGKVQFR